jgi:putative transposase
LKHCTHEVLWTSIEDLVRAHVRDFVEAVAEDELSVCLDRERYGRGGEGYRNGHRERTLLTTFGPLEISVPRARLFGSDGESSEFHCSMLPRSKRLTKSAEALIVATYLCGVSTRRSAVALAQVLGPGVSRSTVSRCLQDLRPSWEAFQKRDLKEEGIERLILDGFSLSVRIDGKSTRMTILVAMGICSDGRKFVLSFKEMAGESKAAWQEILEDLSERGVGQPALAIVDGSKGLEAALAEIWPKILVQRCTVHKERNLLAHAPESLHEELKEDYVQMMYAASVEECQELRGEFLAKWKSKCPKVAKSLEEAGEQLFSFLRFPPSQWKSLRTTNAIERLNEEFRRRVKVQGMQPNGETVCMLFWALLASGAITMRRVVGYQTLQEKTKEDIVAAA